MQNIFEKESNIVFLTLESVANDIFHQLTPEYGTKKTKQNMTAANFWFINARLKQN